MESEGPYQHIRFPRFEGEPKCSMSCPACAYAEGRKSMENDIKQEMLKIADSLHEGIDCNSTLTQDFSAWKNARGLV